MTKDELKSTIKELQLNEELEQTIYALIEESPEINQEVLNKVALVLEAEANIQDMNAVVAEQEAALYGDVADSILEKANSPKSE